MHTHDQDRPTPQAAEVRRSTESLCRPALAGGEFGALSAEGILYLQRTAGNSSVAGLLDEEPGIAPERSPVLDVVGSGGSPLDTDTRSVMEARLGADFSDVRVHTGGNASESARSIGAEAYTVGSDVVVQSSSWAPGTPEGRHLLAHELTHVVQQKVGPVDGTPAAGGIALSTPTDRFEQEAERNADTVSLG